MVGALCVFLAAAPKITDNANSVAPFWNGLVDWMGTNKGWLTPTNGGIIAWAGYLLKQRSQNRIDTVIKNLLDKCRDASFPKNHDYVDYRVTLFVHKQLHFGGWTAPVLRDALKWWGKDFRRWPWDGWLVPYERSGDFHLASGIYFYAPKHAVDHAEGIVGTLFRSKLATFFSKLPKLGIKPTESQVKKYCDIAGVTPQFVLRKIAQKRPIPLSFWGTYVEVENRAWGVLVVDSRRPELPQDLPEKFGPTLTCISQLLRRRSS